MASRLVLFSKLNRTLVLPKYQEAIICLRRSAAAAAAARYSSPRVEDDDDAHGETGDPKPDHHHYKDNNNNIHHHPTREREEHPKTPVRSNLSSAKLQSPGVNTPIDPHVQQRRSTKSSTKPNKEGQLEYLSCAAGLDGGSPWPDEGETAPSREEQEEDDKHYFKDHKASPLSKIEMGDTRKPLEKVAHATADAYFGDQKEMTWTPEQLDTAEDSLLRAAKMFREAAARGVPEWPHSRRLRELRGED